VLKAHGVVSIYPSLKLQAENELQVPSPAPLRPSGKRTCLACSPTLAARKADRSPAISTGHIMC
jgi:hypothetical protein